MPSTRTGRALTVAAVTTTVLWTGTGTAAADPPADPPADPGSPWTTEDVAYASLPAPDQDLQVFLSVFDVPGEEEIAVVEVFGALGPDNYYECFDGPPIPAELDGLDGARAAGSTTLLCGGPNLPHDVAAHVDVDVVWEPTGRIHRSVSGGPGQPCITLEEARAAEVTGLVTVTIPELDVTATVTEGFGDVRTLTGICLPDRG